MKLITHTSLLVIFSCACSLSYCQNPMNGINLKPIKSIDWTDFDYNQVKPFENVLLVKNLLILSEANHGDGSSKAAQCMILKALIDSSVINTIYTESSWLIIDKISDILKKEKEAGIIKTIPYMRSVELRYWVSNGFWDYLANKIIDGKVTLKGFDVGGSTQVVSELFEAALKLSQVKSYIQSDPADFNAIKYDYENFDAWSVQSYFDEAGYNQQKKFVNAVIESYTDMGAFYKIKSWQAILDFFYWMYKRSSLLKGNKYINVPEGRKQESLFMSIRDSLMANYFLGDYNSKKNIKAVALMSSYHAMHNFSSIEGLNDCCVGSDVKVLGETIHKKLGDELYNMCFITSSGFRGINYYFFKPILKKISRPKKPSLEYYLQECSANYSLIDFKSSSLNDSTFYMSPILNRYMKADWSKVFSGIFYIKRMEGLLLGKEQLK